MSDLVSIKTDGVAVIIIATVFCPYCPDVIFRTNFVDFFFLVYVNDYGQL